MSKHATLPDFVYQRQLDGGERMTLNSTFDENKDVNEPNLGNPMSGNLLTIMKAKNTMKAAMRRWRSLK